MTSLLPRRETLIITAVEIIGEMGIQALSTRELAKRQGVSEGTLFRHFKSKNELLVAVLDYFSQFDADIAASAELMRLPPKQALRFVIKAFAIYYQNYPAITAILQAFDVLRHDPELAAKVNAILTSRNGFVRDLLTAAQGAGEIRAEIDAESLADVVNGFFHYTCLIWRLSDYSFSLQERVLSGVEMILDGFTPKAG
ncbi:TetR family transcriptional regulator [Hydrogenispora ethanolica]|jgi:AcrR family transcriptional regulator|uniref:TetR family transcriptional regulator n=1 Tax=Hydrogenispora ethanolica TaxID=1082276 RepID=A0A4R1RGZ6_HYDET|nr:TetR/AcrR family transcriptional regulator [Hydrogenispora ethanolica]TCL65313.1 TetR family transcriptional regulator [Hydrogenispora ethanolica]